MVELTRATNYIADVRPSILVTISSFLLVLLTGVAILAQEAVHPLYLVNDECVCVRTSKVTETLGASEVTSGKRIEQVFKSPALKKELFLVRVGTVLDGEPVKLWNYGIADEADFNGAGTPDFSWYGGDDTSEEMFLFLSHGRSYDKVDILKTLESAWKERFHTTPPDLGSAGGDYSVGEIRLERFKLRLALTANVDQDRFNSTKKPIAFRIDQALFRS